MGHFIFQSLVEIGVSTFYEIIKFDQKSKFWSKIGILVKIGIFCQKYKFWSKIGILVKHQNSYQKYRIF